MTSYIFVPALSPWTLTVSQTKPLGYPDTVVCYKCSNSAMSITKQITIRQKINCAVALNSNSTSLLKDFSNPAGSHHAAITFSAASQYKSLSPYTSGSALFANVNSADCGDFTACTLKP